MNPENFFNGMEMSEWFCRLPKASNLGDVYPAIPKKVAVMTHDDELDADMLGYEKSIAASSTNFVFSRNARASEGADVQLHYNHEEQAGLAAQAEEFTRLAGRRPQANRNHKLWWRAPHLELANLAMNGIIVDSSTVGMRPYRLCVEGRLLPIWEVPFCVADSGYADMGRNTHAIYNKAARMHDLFAAGHTPIVSLFHPYLKEKTRWTEFYDAAKTYGYQTMSIMAFHEKFLRPADEKLAKEGLA